MSTAKLVPFNFYDLSDEQIHAIFKDVSKDGLMRILASTVLSEKLMWDNTSPESIIDGELAQSDLSDIEEIALSTLSKPAVTSFCALFAICNGYVQLSERFRALEQPLAESTVDRFILSLSKLWASDAMQAATQLAFKACFSDAKILTPKPKKGVTSSDTASWESIVEAITAKREDQAVTAEITASTLLNVLALLHQDETAWYDFEYFLHHEVVVQNESDLDTASGISRDNLLPLYLHQKFTQYLQAYTIFCLFPRKYAEKIGLDMHYDEFVALFTLDEEGDEEEGEDLDLDEFKTDYDEESDQTGFSDYQYVKPLDWTTSDNDDAPSFTTVDDEAHYAEPAHPLDARLEGDSDSDDSEATPEPDDSSDDSDS